MNKSSIKFNRNHKPSQAVKGHNIPESFKQQDRWTLWRWTWDGKKWDKPPVAFDGTNGSSTNPRKWASYQQVARACVAIKADGIGFCMSHVDGVPDCNLVGVDIDGCRNVETGEITPFAQGILDSLNTYAEVSPSGEGVKAWLRATPEDIARLAQFTKQNRELGLEVYCDGRYFTVTGNIVDGCPSEVAAVGEAFFEHMQRYHARTDTSDAQRVSKAIPIDATETLSLAKKAIEYISPDCGYAEWINVGMALNNLSVDAFDVWDEWSSGGVAYPGASKLKAHWRSFPGAKGKVSIATLFHYAIKAGFKMPEVEKIPASKSDPLFTAREVQQEFEFDDQPTLKYWQGNFYEWTQSRGCYRVLSTDDIQARVLEVMDRKLCKIKSADVYNVLMRLRGLCRVGDVPLPVWVGSNEQPWPAHESVVTVDKILNARLFSEGKDGYLINNSPSLFGCSSTGYKYPGTDTGCPTWLGILDEQLGVDVKVLQEFCYLLLTSGNPYHKMLALIGPPRSGKGLISQVLRLLVGSDNVVSPSLADFSRPFGRQQLLRASLATINDARLDPRTSQTAIVESLLNITSGDPVSIDRKHQDAINVVLPTRIVLVSNELPRLTDPSGALASRMIILKTRKSYAGKEDMTLGQRLESELHGIFHWALRGGERLRQQNRFSKPINGLSNQMDELSSPIKAFVHERCALATGCRGDLVESIYLAWRDWARDNGHHVTSSSTFGRDLQAAFQIEKHRPLVNVEIAPGQFSKKRAYCYEGLMLNENCPF